MKKIHFRKLKFVKPKFFLTLFLALFEIYFGVIFGYFLGKFLSGKETGQPGIIKSIVFNIGNYKLHLHHWLFALVILILEIFYRFLPFPKFSIGFLSGIIFQGIYSYSDWYKILIKRGF